MNYAEARQLSDGGGWHYTVRNDDRIWTHQCCLDPGPPATQDDVEKYGYQLGEPTLGKPHAPHATREEAEECYHAWRLRRIEETLAFSDEMFGDWTGCRALLDPERVAAVASCATPAYHETHRYCPSCPWTEADREPARCDAPTKGGARYRDDHLEHLVLCPVHRTPEVVLAQVERVTRSVYS